MCKSLQGVEIWMHLDFCIRKFALEGGGIAEKQRVAGSEHHYFAVNLSIFFKHLAKGHCYINPFSIFSQQVLHKCMVAFAS